ncbi:MAG: right-handed parallel beta-helix repeat-containing protein, partial [Bacilli bacterium]|nr:right-handed parallel beta-helix repeat-containing protein [Bacilli bacterium]
APAGSIIIVLPGVYDEAVVVDKAITLKTLNAASDPTENDAVFKAESETATTITNVWAVNASNISIKGFSFTGAARIKSYSATISAGFANFLFENNYVYDTAKATIEWKETAHLSSGSDSASVAVPGFISLYPLYTWLHNYKYINNKFSNVSDTHIFMVCAAGATFKGNVFSGGDRDAIRFEYAATYGNITIEDNVFENLNYNGIYFRSYVGSAWVTALNANIYNNSFKNIGAAAATYTATSTRIGAISTRGYGETQDAYFNIKFNNFENCANYISLRDNVTDYATWSEKGKTWAAVIEYNAFIDSEAVSYYFANLLNASDSETTNTGNVVLNHNFYGTSAEAKATISEAQFGYYRKDDSNLVVYDTLAALDAAIAALDQGYEIANNILVDETLAEAEAGAEIIVNNLKYIVGTNAFATLPAAMAVAEDNATIIVMPGVYSGDISVTKDNVSILGPNANVDPNKKTRGDEALIDGKITLGTGIKNFTVNGFSYKFVLNEKLITGEAAGLIDGFKFLYNIVDARGTAYDGGTGFIQFKQTSAENGIKNFTIAYNNFSGFTSDRIIRLAYIENLEIYSNVFADATTDAIRIRDNSGGLTGKLILKDNIFTNIGQFAVFVGPYNASEIIVKNNLFDNCGSVYGGGALSFRDCVVRAEGTYIEISGNIFNGSDATDIRFDHKATEQDDLEIVVFANEFRVPGMTYYNNNNADAAVKTVFYGNTLLGEAGELLDPTLLAAQIKNAKIGLEAPTIYVDQTKTDLEAGAEVTLEHIEETLIFGTNLFNDVDAAVAVLQPGGTLFLLPGEYNKTIKVGVSHVTITTLNGELNPNDETAVRYAEAISREDFYILPSTKNITFKGLEFKHYSQLFIQNNTENIVIKNNIFREDYFNVNRPAIDINGMLAWTGTYAKMVKYLTIENNLFDNIHTRESAAAGNHTVRGIGLMYTENLIIRNNVMDGFGENYFYGLYGKTVIENNEFLGCRYRSLNLVNVMDDIDIMNNKFSMTAAAGKPTRVINLWYSGDWYNGTATDGSLDFYRDGIVVNIKFNDVVVDSNTVCIFELDPSVSAVDGTYVYKYNYHINCNYNSVTGELGEESVLVYTDKNKLNAKFNYWGSEAPDSNRFKYGSELSKNIDYSEFFASKEALTEAIGNLE